MASIVLGGISMPVVVQASTNFISPWLARLGTGEPRFSELEPASHWVLRSFAGGFGKERGDIFEDTARFFDSTLWTHLDGKPRLPSADAGATLTGADDLFKPSLTVEHNGLIYVFGRASTATYPIWLLKTGPAWDDVSIGPATATSITDAAVQGQDMFVAPSGGGGADFWRLDGAAPGVWSQPSAGEKAYSFAAYEDDTVVKVSIIQSGAANIAKSTDRGVTWTAVAIIGTVGGIIGAMAGPMVPFLTTAPEGGLTRVIALGLHEGIWAIDVTNNRAWKILDLSSQIHNNNCFMLSVGNTAEEQGSTAEALYVPVGKMGLAEVHPNGRVLWIGPDQDDSLPKERQGIITGMADTNYFLYVAISPYALERTGDVANGFGTPSTNYASILVMNKVTHTWHHIYMHGTTARSITALHLTGNVDSTQRLYFWVVKPNDYTVPPVPLYIQLPIDRFDQNDLDSLVAETSGYIVTPWFNKGFVNLPGVLLSLSAEAGSLSATHTLEVLTAVADSAYAVNADTNFTTRATWTSGPRTSLWRLVNGTAPTETLGLDFDLLRLKLRLANTDGSPKVTRDFALRHVIADYIALPPRLRAWRLRVYNDPRSPLVGVSNAGLYDEIARLAATSKPIAFYPNGMADVGAPTQERYFVRISAITEYNYQNGGPRGSGGWIDIVISEVMQSNAPSTVGGDSLWEFSS